MLWLCSRQFRAWEGAAVVVSFLFVAANARRSPVVAILSGIGFCMAYLKPLIVGIACKRQVAVVLKR